MAGNNTKEIKSRIKAVQNTQKVTRSMKLLSTIKLQQINRIIANAKAFRQELLNIIRKAAHNIEEVNNKKLLDLFARPESTTKTLLIVISSDRGLCGAFNNNIYKYLHKYLKDNNLQADNTELYAIGNKICRYARKHLAEYNIINAMPNSELEKHNIAAELLKLYAGREYQSVKIIYTHYISTMSSQNTDFELFPLQKENFFRLSIEDKNNICQNEELILEPSAEELLMQLIPLYCQDRMQEAMNNSRASEYSNRVNAMTAATDNATELINEFTLQYNKARQSAITQEISEIVGGMIAMG